MDKLSGIINCLKATLNIDTIMCGIYISGLIEETDGFKPSVELKITDKCLIGSIYELKVIIDLELDENDMVLYDGNSNKLLDLSTHGV